MAPVIRLHGVSKHYTGTYALNGIDMDISQGTFGLIGPNGAGKTTLIKLLCGLLRPTSGTIRIMGHPPGSPEANSAIGYLSENQGYYEFSTPQQYLRYFGELYGLSREDIDERTAELLRMVNLQKNARDPISTFSRGMRQRVGIARAMMHDPDIYILDEPLSGLDPIGRREFLKILADLREMGRTILLSSHELKDMDTICDEICILRKGLKVAQGNPNSLIAGAKGARETLSFNLHSPSDALALLQKEIEGILDFRTSPEGFSVTIAHDPPLERRILKWLLVKKVDFSVQKHVIDNLYSYVFEDQQAVEVVDEQPGGELEEI